MEESQEKLESYWASSLSASMSIQFGCGFCLITIALLSAVPFQAEWPL